MNLVLIGRFQSVSAAEAAVERMKALQVLADKQWDTDDWRRQHDRMDDELLHKLTELKLYDMGRTDVEMFAFEHTVERTDTAVTISTEESDIQGFLKVLIHLGAKVEVFSRHDWNEDGTAHSAPASDGVIGNDDSDPKG